MSPVVGLLCPGCLLAPVSRGSVTVRQELQTGRETQKNSDVKRGSAVHRHHVCVQVRLSLV